ncbi:hypothetical protein KW794_01115 [Candidatus Saccharibacteria bacterium]|nr:hypothetical protein [Candidatus Saccharibacteria bacterium]
MARASKRARRTSAFYMPGAFDLFTPSKELVLKNIWIFGPLYALSLVFYIHSWIWSPLPNQPVSWWHHADGFSSAWPGSPLPIHITFLSVGFSVLWLLIIMLIGTIVQIMSNAAQLVAAEGKRLDFNNLWQIVKELGWRMWGLYLLTGLIVFVGLVLLIVPGLIFIRRYFLAPYVMLDKKTDIMESLNMSASLSKANTGAVWGVIGVMFLIGLLNILPYIGGLAAFVIGALYSVAPALRYQQLKKLA